MALFSNMTTFCHETQQQQKTVIRETLSQPIQTNHFKKNIAKVTILNPRTVQSSLETACH